jgi:hypothetical protein
MTKVPACQSKNRAHHVLREVPVVQRKFRSAISRLGFGAAWGSLP